jgi:hypothetical protein
VTLLSDDGRRALHFNFYGDRSDLYWEAQTDLLLAWGSVPPGAPGGQVVDDAEYAYDNPWFALPDRAEPFEITAGRPTYFVTDFSSETGRCDGQEAGAIMSAASWR